MAKQKPGKKENLDDLKQELDIDYHKITSDELYQRFQTHPENVSNRMKKFLFRKSEMQQFQFIRCRV